ncbi:MAG TPA: carbohydrate porin [Xanthobacteraceae bacterium]|nr:carbohydrate porin [Xanthobacteraceae bacterium]
MGLLSQKIQKRPDWSPGVSAFAAACGACAALLCWSEGAADAADLSRVLPTKAPPAAAASAADGWTGFYAGGHFGYAAGFSSWTATQAGAATPSLSGSLDLFQGYDLSTGRGSYLLGFQAGYNYMLPSRIVLGAEADVSFPSVLGASQAIASPLIGQAIYRDQVQMSGTVRGRIGYAPGHWLFYATGGFAYSFDEFSRTQVAGVAIGGTAVAGTVENLFMVPRIGGAVGAGVEVALTPRWMARLEYLFTDYGSRGVTFPAGAQNFSSDLAVHTVRVGLDYRLGRDGIDPQTFTKRLEGLDLDTFAVHGQTTFVENYAPPFRSPYLGQNSLIPNQGRETFDATAYLGMRLWQGAELWIDPEIDQGFGLNATTGIAGFPSGEALKRGESVPYARIPRAFVRQTVNLGGDTQKVEAGPNQFGGSQSANRLVFTVGKFAINDVFDTNKYAHDPKRDFMNWALIDTGTFDFAGDAWGLTYGAAAEWYQGDWTLRGGAFVLSTVPGSTDLDTTFSQFQWVAEIERRYELWGHPGKIAVTGFLSRGSMGSFQDAINLAQATGTPANIAAVRKYQSHGGVSMNVEQEITSDLGAFVRAGWADGAVEPFDVTDIDRTVAAGLSLKGKQWGRPDDTFGLAGIVNAISGVHQQFLNAGGLGLLIGDGMLPHPGPEQIIETYYAFPLLASTVTLDYQFVVNPAYNRDRGPVSVIGARVHAEF